ncbi:MAG: HlyD family efflux transporter periplasmic adaptor subunit [Clostridiales bacterium]|jgi:multidrug efflux pump subunit AcrA (membrane-fusion protein)|nr:HlyD family efflux transporter periplasmic adaptor subunit [Clostridiales bacterium]
MKKKSKAGLILLLLVIALGVGGFAVFSALATQEPPAMSHTVLQLGDLTESINIRGAVESTNRRNVYSTLNFLVEEIFVEVGDFVQAGDILAVLDTADLELNIRQQRAEMNAMDESNRLNLRQSRRVYEDARTNLDTGQNPQVLNAETAYSNAATNMDIALRNYENARDDYENPINAQLLQAQSTLTLASIELDNLQRTHENNIILLAAGGISRNAFDNSETALTTAQSRFADAAAALENAETATRRALDNARDQLTTARVAYDNAYVALASAHTGAGQEIDRLFSNVESSQIAINNEARLIAIERLQRQLDDSIITAPISGTVTVNFATVGSVAGGLMFVIEDTDNLKITTRIREYDATQVQVGMAVEIRTDSTGAAVFDGQVSSMDPTALRNALGDIANLGDVEFGAEIAVLSTDTPLLIGMNTRLTVVLDQRHDIFFVPFDAIFFDMAENAYVFVVDAHEGRGTARSMPVEIGLETDFFVEIISPELSPGMKVLNNAAAVTEGMEVTVN